MGLAYTDRIRVRLGGNARVQRIVRAYAPTLELEVLAIEVSVGPLEAAEASGYDLEADVDGEDVRIRVEPVDA
jgi:hypothetical protein